MSQENTLRMALTALESCSGAPHWDSLQPTVTAIKQALAAQPAPVREPFMWACNSLDETEWETSNHQECEHCIPLYTTPPAAQPAVPTKEMIDAAERIDWSGSDVRGNIINMWQAMTAAAPEKGGAA